MSFTATQPDPDLEFKQDKLTDEDIALYTDALDMSETMTDFSKFSVPTTEREPALSEEISLQTSDTSNTSPDSARRGWRDLFRPSFSRSKSALPTAGSQTTSSATLSTRSQRSGSEGSNSSISTYNGNSPEGLTNMQRLLSKGSSTPEKTQASGKFQGVKASRRARSNTVPTTPSKSNQNSTIATPVTPKIPISSPTKNGSPLPLLDLTKQAPWF